MELHQGTCEHHWRYFVHVATRAIRAKECERCGRRSVVPAQLEPVPQHRPAETRLSA